MEMNQDLHPPPQELHDFFLLVQNEAVTDGLLLKDDVMCLRWRMKRFSVTPPFNGH